VYNASFPPASASAAIKWAKERVEEFNASLERQLSSVERGSQLWNECLQIVHGYANMLGEVGVDFNGIVAKGLEEPIANGVYPNGGYTNGAQTLDRRINGATRT